MSAPQGGFVAIAISDTGAGMAEEIRDRAFEPFFTTRDEGMGLGLSLCRTVIEQHGGALDFQPRATGPGTEFRFTLPSDATLEPAAGMPAETHAT